MVASLPVSMLKYAGEEEEEDEEEDSEMGVDAGEDVKDMDSANTIPLPKRRKRKRTFAASHYPLTANYELVELRKKKLQLECAKLELELEKMPLECAKLELEIQKLQRDLMSSGASAHNQDTTDQTQIQH